MKDNPRVSVVSPCYNHGKYIREMLASVFAQTFTDYEVLIVNDGSTDGTREILEGIVDARVRVFHTENKGPASARNRGIREARAPLILNLDADDKIAPTLLEKAVAVFDQNPNAGIVHSDVRLFGARSGRFELPPYTLAAMLEGNVIHSTAFFRKADWKQQGGYADELIYGVEDFDFWLALIELGREVHKIPEELVFYRKYRDPQDCRSGRQRANRRMYYQAFLTVFDRHQNLFRKEPAIHARMAALKLKLENENRVLRRLKEIAWAAGFSRVKA